MIEDVFSRYGIPHQFETGVPLLRVPFIKYWFALLDLVSSDREVSNLTGDAFKRWNGKTVGELFEVTRDTMPPKEERSLDNQVYLNMVAYILQFKKVPSGNQELKHDIETLKQIVIAPPPG